MPKIDTTKIDGYDAMTADQKIAALTSFEYEDNSAELEKLKNANTKANSEAAEWKRKHNALLSDEEKKKQENADHMAELEKKVETLEQEKKISGYEAKFLAQGYSAELAKDTAVAMASGDTDKVFANQAAFLTEHDKALNAENLKKTPRPGVGNGSGGIDFKKKYEEASANGDYAAAAYYNRLLAEQEASNK